VCDAFITTLAGRKDAAQQRNWKFTLCCSSELLTGATASSALGKRHPMPSLDWEDQEEPQRESELP